jgi:hypothetical protein
MAGITLPMVRGPRKVGPGGGQPQDGLVPAAHRDIALALRQLVPHQRAAPAIAGGLQRRRQARHHAPVAEHGQVPGGPSVPPRATTTAGPRWSWYRLGQASARTRCRSMRPPEKPRRINGLQENTLFAFREPPEKRCADNRIADIKRLSFILPFIPFVLPSTPSYSLMRPRLLRRMKMFSSAWWFSLPGSIDLRRCRRFS